MLRILNIGDTTSSLETLEKIKNNDYSPFEVRIQNSHIIELNKEIGIKVFKNNTLFINSKTLWEIMHPIGGKGKHHYHGLTPSNILEALKTMRHSKDVSLSYDGRYIIISLAKDVNDKFLAIIVDPNGTTKDNGTKRVSRIVTIYPQKKK